MMISSKQEWPDSFKFEGRVYECIGIVYEFKSPSPVDSYKDYDMSIRITKDALPDLPEPKEPH